MSLIVGLIASGTTTGTVSELSVLFVAAQATHYALLLLLAGTAGQTADFDDVTVYQSS